MSILVGKPAPDFNLEGVFKDEFVSVKLSDYRGHWVVVFFYPLDFTFVCPTEITGFSRRYNEFKDLDASVLGISVDSKYSHQAWIEGTLGELNYPLLSDMTRETSRAYEVLLEDQGITLRGAFIIDPEGIIRYQVVHDLGVGRSVDEILRVLTALQTGELCPMEWKPGTATLGKG